MDSATKCKFVLPIAAGMPPFWIRQEVSVFVRVSLSVRSMLPRLWLCDAHDEPPMLDTFQANQATGECFNLRGFSMDHENFQARIVIEMCMTCRDHQPVMRVLKFGQLLRDPIGVMVVDECDRTDDRRIGFGRLLNDQTIAD